MTKRISQIALAAAFAITAGVFAADSSVTSADAAAKHGCKATIFGTHQCNFTQQRKAKLTPPPGTGARPQPSRQNFRAGGDFSNGRDSEGGNGGGRR